MRASVCASSGWTSRSPGSNGVPLFRKIRLDSGEVGRLFDPLNSSASPQDKGKPFDASSTAGAMSSAHFFRPYLLTAISKPRTVPGTPDDRQPSMLSFVSSPLASRYMLRVAFSGARSRKSMNVVRPSAIRISM